MRLRTLLSRLVNPPIPPRPARQHFVARHVDGRERRELFRRTARGKRCVPSAHRRFGWETVLRRGGNACDETSREESATCAVERKPPLRRSGSICAIVMLPSPLAAEDGLLAVHAKE